MAPLDNQARVVAYLPELTANPGVVASIETRLMEAAGLYGFPESEGDQTQRQRLIVTTRATLALLPVAMETAQNAIKRAEAGPAKTEFANRVEALKALWDLLRSSLEEALEMEGLNDGEIPTMPPPGFCKW